MRAKVVIHLEDISDEELYRLLQAVRDAEQDYFSEKMVSISVEAPELPAARADQVLARIRPPFSLRLTVAREEKGEVNAEAPIQNQVL